MYHTESITRYLINKGCNHVSSIFIGGNLKKIQIENYSKDTATPQERAQYFSLAGSIFTVSGVLLAFIFIPLLILHLALFKSINFMSLYFFVFIFPLTMGNIFMIKEHRSKKGIIETFTKTPLVISVTFSLVASLCIEGLFFAVINFS